MWNKIEKTTFADIDFCFSCCIFKKNHGFIEEDNPSEKVVIVEEELNRVDIDDIGNLVDLLRFVFIDEACLDLKVVNDGGELTRNIKQKKNQTFHNSLLMLTRWQM